MRHAREELNMRRGGPVILILKERKRVKQQRPKVFVRAHDPQPSELAARLDRIADVRQSAVRRGKLLIANPNYPDAKVIRGVARVLAKHWGR